MAFGFIIEVVIVSAGGVKGLREVTIVVAIVRRRERSMSSKCKHDGLIDHKERATMAQ